MQGIRVIEEEYKIKDLCERKYGKMAKKKVDFTAADRKERSRDEAIKGTIAAAEETTEKLKRQYNRLDPREKAAKEIYSFTARMPYEYGRFLNELAYQRRSTITAEVQRLVKEEMEKRPEILANLDELND